MKAEKERGKYFTTFQFDTNKTKEYLRQEVFPELIMQKSTFLPGIIGKSEDNYFAIYGPCYDSFVYEFFEHVLCWFDSFLTKTNTSKLRIEFWYEYFNTQASKINLDILKAFEKYIHEHPSAAIDVYFYVPSDDIDMIEAGNEYKKEVKNINFEVVILDDKQYKQMTKLFT